MPGRNIAEHGGKFWQLIGARDAKLERIINADVNNAFYEPSPIVLGVIQSQLSELRHLPDSNCKQLKKDLASFHRIDETKIEVGAGSSDLLQTIITGFVGKGDHVILLSPTYSEYERCARSVGARIKKVMLRRSEGFVPDVSAILDQVDPATRMLIICNPNNPTGCVLKRADLLTIIGALDRNVWLVIDEAYIDYSPDESLIAETSRWPNLVVVRTFSKAYALAALRVGYAVLGEDAATRLSGLVRRPWPVSLLSLKAAEAALGDDAYVRKMVSVTRSLMRSLTEELNHSGRMTAFSSVTNYFLLDVKDSGRKTSDIIHRLQEKWILVRDCSSFGEEFSRFIRITTQSELDNRRISDALGALLR